MGSGARPRASTADEIIRAREARGLYWSLLTRLIVLAIFGVLSILHLLDLIAPGVAAERDFDAVANLLIMSSAIAVLSYFMRLARRQTRLEVVGLGAIALDLLLASSLPVIWYFNLETPDGSPTFLMKNELFTLCIPFVVISTLALRPLYPIVSASGFVVLQVVLALFVLSHPSTSVSPQYMDHYYTDAVNPGVTVIRIIVLMLIGAFLAMMAASARKTIHDAVRLEVANVEIKERQAEMLLEGKLSAMSNLVAGVAHELNTPLGVVASGVETSEAVLRRLEPLAVDDPKLSRMVSASRGSGVAVRAGLDRMKEVVTSLRSFARLDESELQHADVREGLDSTLALIERERFGEIEIVKEWSEVPRIECRPKELNQVFMTLIVNALDAMDGRGALRLETSVDASTVHVVVADTGPGITQEIVDTLFEFRFNEKRGRMSLGLGLPTAHRIVERHGGNLSVESVPGQGTTFTLALPVEGTR